MDVGEWLTKIKHRYNLLLDMDPTALLDRDFAHTIVNNLPQRSPEWRAYAKGFRQCFSQYKHMRPPQPITSREVIDDIHKELYFSTQDNPNTDTHVFAANSNNKKSGKHPHPADTSSSSSPSKRTCTSLSSSTSTTCMNAHCGHTGHDISGCFAYGGSNQGNYCSN
jgi:hypothetical protein